MERYSLGVIPGTSLTCNEKPEFNLGDRAIILIRNAIRQKEIDLLFNRRNQILDGI